MTKSTDWYQSEGGDNNVKILLVFLNHSNSPVLTGTVVDGKFSLEGCDSWDSVSQLPKSGGDLLAQKSLVLNT